MYYIVYKTTNIVNNKFYVGIHKTDTMDFDGYFGSGLRLMLAIKKYGEDCFVRETLHVFSSLDEARCKEREIVDLDFCHRKDTYNISIGGTGGNTIAGYDEAQMTIYIDNRKNASKKAEETKRRNFEAMTLEEQIEFMEKKKQNMLAVRIQPANKGRIHSVESKTRMKAANHMTGKKHYTNGEKNILIHEGYDVVPDGFFPGRKGIEPFKGHDKETLARMSEKRTGKVYATDGLTNMIFDSVEAIPVGWRRGFVRKNKVKAK